MGNVLVVAEHLNGALGDVTFEMLAHAKGLAQALGGEVHAALLGGNDEMTRQLGAASTVYSVPVGAEFDPETHAAALAAVVEKSRPQVTLVASTSMGMDLAGACASRVGLPLVAYCTSIVYSSGTLRATSQLYGGKMLATSDLGMGPCVAMMLPGYANADSGRTAGLPAVQAMAAPGTAGKIRFKRLVMPPAGDVDITTKDILVAIGRGIGKKEDIETAQELADALGAAVAASRPVIDAGWLPKARQVGKSGLKVKPKVYLALGISGAPEHIEGMKASSTIIAVNTDKNAPIFDVAHYGIVGDLFEICEALMEKL